ncbi:MAG: DUF4080 domain-containing protein [Fusobacteriota bacterium]
MKTLLVGVNSKYSHTNLAIRYIKSFVEKNSNFKIDIREWTINQKREDIIKGIFNENPDILGFSVYIWNSEYIFQITREIKKILPKIKIILGGPEVSYDSKEILENNSEIDYIIKGEGEKTFLEFLKYDISKVKGVYYKNENNKISFNGTADYIKNLDTIDLPYSKYDLKEKLKNKIIYYESSRGCPFNCSYCMSSIDKKVRFFSNSKVKKDLKFFMENGVELVKFIDRTYNLDKERYLEIWKFLLDNYNPKSKFHFEIHANLFDNEILSFLKKIPKDYFQFEIGIQTSNQKSLEAINRKNDLDKLRHTIQKLKSYNNIHIHLDLIAGLPYETYELLKRSFEYIYTLNADMFQLGFLKILKGTQIEREAKKHGYKYLDFPPYEILENKYISYEKMLVIKNIEELIDIYYNSKLLRKTIDYAVSAEYNKYFDFYEEFSKYWTDNGYFEVKHKRKKYFYFLYTFLKDKSNINKNILKNFLKYEYLLIRKPGFFPKWYDRDQDKSKYDKLIKKEDFRTNREGYKKSEFERFDYNILENKSEEIEILFLYNGKETRFRVIK